MSDFELYHYGVKGQKWGVRRATKVRASKNASEDHIIKKAAKKTPISQMSNAELKRANERMNLEKNYRELSSKGALNKIKKGTQIVTTLTAVGTAGATIYNLVNGPAGKAAISAGAKALAAFKK